ncbi:hypothetical protein [Pseudoalteromonas phenolica]|uniref:Uncharacterized protein n=1 Tax=Pseudoalteromonas phenolica TaxID=161398 RepID=A0A0S2JZI3_9GAMM|nr:hypothetical protein [Pseudoalteromonas phenolica]ALO41623.1 hypothetical protein PP2015_1107 [Pseudoalteromonas phenolica]MBE0353827.1 hypothetical protein [Pseudoalteromonas phenolica O-BC30]RXE91743.1 hypothetical protein D9981_22130 [Pseudoalteromonas phenolica O-BC30]TMO57267.1 hypothetical protein CWC21_05145 [Pseudoalteromonas phenolica]
MRVLFISLLFFMIITLSFQSAEGASANFKASIIGWQPKAQSEIQQLGEFASCKVVNTIKYDNFNSACFLKKERSGWQLESFASRCEVECLKMSNPNKTAHPVRFNQINP